MSKENSNFSLKAFLSDIHTSTNKGGKRESIYKVGIISTDENTAKKERAKIRKKLDAICSDIIKFDIAKNKEMLSNLISSFDSFYCTIYKINDYSLNSLCSDQTNEEKKEKIKKTLSIIEKNKKATNNKK